jgi:hypothetical protein
LSSENLKPNQTRATTIALLALIFTLVIAPPLDAQPAATQTPFTSKDVFHIPDLNGNVSFAFNGSYTEAELENNTWTFKGLQLNNTAAVQQYGFTNYTNLGTLKISATNSNVTVLAFLSFNYSIQADILALYIDGWGTQTVNLGLNATEKRPVAEWSVLTDNGATFLAEGSGWKLQNDNSVFINYGAGNITIVHFYLTDPSMANLSFLAQHYVAILTGAALAATVAVAGVISFRRYRKSKSDLPS